MIPCVGMYLERQLQSSAELLINSKSLPCSVYALLHRHFCCTCPAKSPLSNVSNTPFVEPVKNNLVPSVATGGSGVLDQHEACLLRGYGGDNIGQGRASETDVEYNRNGNEDSRENSDESSDEDRDEDSEEQSDQNADKDRDEDSNEDSDDDSDENSNEDSGGDYTRSEPCTPAYHPSTTKHTEQIVDNDVPARENESDGEQDPTGAGDYRSPSSDLDDDDLEQNNDIDENQSTVNIDYRVDFVDAHLSIEGYDGEDDPNDGHSLDVDTDEIADEMQSDSVHNVYAVSDIVTLLCGRLEEAILALRDGPATSLGKSPLDKDPRISDIQERCTTLQQKLRRGMGELSLAEDYCRWEHRCQAKYCDVVPHKDKLRIKRFVEYLGLSDCAKVGRALRRGLNHVAARVAAPGRPQLQVLTCLQRWGQKAQCRETMTKAIQKLVAGDLADATSDIRVSQLQGFLSAGNVLTEDFLEHYTDQCRKSPYFHLSQFASLHCGGGIDRICTSHKRARSLLADDEDQPAAQKLKWVTQAGIEPPGRGKNETDIASPCTNFNMMDRPLHSISRQSPGQIESTQPPAEAGFCYQNLSDTRSYWDEVQFSHQPSFSSRDVARLDCDEALPSRHASNDICSVNRTIWSGTNSSDQSNFGPYVWDEVLYSYQPTSDICSDNHVTWNEARSAYQPDFDSYRCNPLAWDEAIYSHQPTQTAINPSLNTQSSAMLHWDELRFSHQPSPNFQTSNEANGSFVRSPCHSESQPILGAAPPFHNPQQSHSNLLADNRYLFLDPSEPFVSLTYDPISCYGNDTRASHHQSQLVPAI